MADSEDYVELTTPEAHAASHKSGGSDEIDVTGLTPADHASRHESGGDDKIAVTGLTGNMVWVDRGDPASNDWNVGDLIKDGTWRDLDCSGIVPAGTTTIAFKVIMSNSVSISMDFHLRKNGNSNSVNEFRLTNQLIDVDISGFGIVPCDSSRFVEYNASDSDFWTTLSVVILGWSILS